MPKGQYFPRANGVVRGMAIRRTAAGALDLDHDLLIRNTVTTVASKARSALAVMREVLLFERGKTGVSNLVTVCVPDGADKASIAKLRSLAD